MAVRMRNCIGLVAFPAITNFLYGLYHPNNRDGNWFQPIWEYAYTHPWFDEESVSEIGIWEDAGTIVGVAQYESRLGEAFFQIHPTCEHLKPEMLSYAERHLSGITDHGKKYFKVYVNDFDAAFEQVVRSLGYKKRPESHRPMAQLVIPDPFPPIRLPNGFQFKSLAEDNDLTKLDRVLWRGFNHPGEPPDDGTLGREKMQSGPHFRKDLAIVIEAPKGIFAAFGGLWFDPVNKIAYVEPVATDPDYRQMGIGTAAVLEGIRRCGLLGATVAYVGSAMPFYLAMGFKKLFTQNCWSRFLSSD